MAKPRGFGAGFGPGFGVGKYRYTLAPWEWVTSPFPHWQIPTSAKAVGLVDLRPIAAQAAAGGVPQGLAFCASMQPTSGVEIAHSLNMADEDATTGMRDMWETQMGFRPQGDKLVDFPWEQLTDGADPAGETGPKPLMPTNGFLELWLGGHSLVKREWFRWGVHKHTNRVRDVLRRDFEAMWEFDPGTDRRGQPITGSARSLLISLSQEHSRRVLDATCIKYRIDDWREFVPPRLHAHVPGRLPHATTHTDDFNTADSTTLGADLTWTDVTGNWQNYLNAAIQVEDAVFRFARAESDVSSADHYAQARLIFFATDVQEGPCARFAAAATTFYFTTPYAGDNKMYTGKIIAGTPTYLDSPTITPSIPETYKIECNGSTIKAYQAGVERVSVTDSAISGGTRGGLAAYYDAAADFPRMDDYEIADLAAPAGNRRRRVLLGAA